MSPYAVPSGLLPQRPCWICCELFINVNTSSSMTETIGESARHYASPGTEIIALQPHFGAEAVDCNFESYLSAVGVMDRIVTYDGPFDAVVMAGFGEHGRDGLQELIEQPVVEICQASAQVATLMNPPPNRALAKKR